MEEKLKDQPEASGSGDEGEASLEELMAKRREADEGSDAEEESVVSTEREERVGTLPSKVAPQQTTEFVCKRCFLVKHRSQLADKRRTLCADCA